MNFLQRLFGGRRRGGTAYADVTANEIDQITHASVVLGDVSVPSNAVDIVAKSCMGTEPLCKEKNKVVETTATSLLNNPNPLIGGDELMYRAVEDIYLGACTYIVLVGNIKRPAVEMHRIDPIKVSSFADAFGKIARYTVMMDEFQGVYELDRATGRYLNLQNDFVELLCVKHPSGRSILNSCRTEIDVLSIGLNRNGAMIKNGGRISMLLTFKDHVDGDELDKRMRSIEAAARSKGYGGFLGITSGENGVEVKEMGLSPRDMDFSTLQDMCRREVYFRCGIPLPLIDNAAATDNNMAAAKEQLYTETILPICDLVYGRVGRLLAIREGRDYTTATNQIKIPAMRGVMLTELERRKAVNIETINELRELAGKERMEGGDQLYIEARMVSLGTSQNQLG